MDLYSFYCSIIFLLYVGISGVFSAGISFPPVLHYFINGFMDIFVNEGMVMTRVSPIITHYREYSQFGMRLCHIEFPGHKGVFTKLM